jgi:hypothetical protein
MLASASVLASALALAGVVGHAAEPGPAKKAKAEAADEELLEFLGSIDDGESDSAWYEWLTRNDPAKVGKAKEPPKKSTS